MRTTIILLILVIATGKSFSQGNEHLNVKKGIAIEGYDPVSYFANNPVEGKESLKYVHNGATYLFSSAANRQKFIDAPEKYIPEYGGWCAYAIGDSGKKVKVDPKTYKIKEGKLYLFYNFGGYNTLDDWNKNEDSLRKAADVNWKKITQ